MKFWKEEEPRVMTREEFDALPETTKILMRAVNARIFEELCRPSYFECFRVEGKHEK